MLMHASAAATSTVASRALADSVCATPATSTPASFAAPSPLIRRGFLPPPSCSSALPRDAPHTLARSRDAFLLTLHALGLPFSLSSLHHVSSPADHAHLRACCLSLGHAMTNETRLDA
jgi:hypothetical protein